MENNQVIRNHKKEFYCKGTRFEKFEGYSFSQKDWDELKAKGVLDESKKDLTDDCITTFEPENWRKIHCKRMYSPLHDVLRHTTIDEFYGNGIVN